MASRHLSDWEGFMSWLAGWLATWLLALLALLACFALLCLALLCIALLACLVGGWVGCLGRREACGGAGKGSVML